MTEKMSLYRPKTLQQALELLASRDGAKPISGGATLVAMLNADLADPTILVSLKDVLELSGVSVGSTGEVRIGAFTRHRDVAAASLLSGTLSVMSEAASQIASAAVRNMGTIGGAIAHADPGLDFPAALVAANAQIEIGSLQGNRRVTAEQFFVDWYTTVLEPGELVVAVYLPKPEEGFGRYLKLARVSGDFAIVSVAASVSKARRTRVAIGGCGPTPISSAEVNDLLSSDLTSDAVDRAGVILGELADPLDDVRGTADYRRMLIPRMLRQVMGEIKSGMGI